MDSSDFAPGFLAIATFARSHLVCPIFQISSIFDTVNSAVSEPHDHHEISLPENFHDQIDPLNIG
jgi:hypothetical protein